MSTAFSRVLAASKNGTRRVTSKAPEVGSYIRQKESYLWDQIFYSSSQHRRSLLPHRGDCRFSGGAVLKSRTSDRPDASHRHVILSRHITFNLYDYLVPFLCHFEKVRSPGITVHSLVLLILASENVN